MSFFSYMSSIYATFVSKNTSSSSATSTSTKSSSTSSRSLSSGLRHHSRLGGRGKGSRPNASKPLFLEQPFVNATLVNGSLRKVCSLPRFVDSNEWLAVNTFDFFMHTNFFYDAVAEFCDEAGECAVMNGGPSFEYTWTDSQRRTVKLSAPQYVDSAMSWIQTVLYDEQIFPTKGTNPFPKDLQNTLRAIYKHLFRIFAHIYHCHYDKILHMSAEGHLNTLFAHVICFGREFDLLDKKELSPMSEFITELEKSGRI